MAEKVPAAQTSLRMRLLSETKALPLASTATFNGLSKKAAPPMPSADAGAPHEVDPLPASELTTPPGVTKRMRRLLVSATSKLPIESKARPPGELNEAPVPVPSPNPCPPLPASVLTTPSGVTLRRRESLTTKTLPDTSTATPFG